MLTAFSVSVARELLHYLCNVRKTVADMLFCAQKYDAQYWKTTLNLTGHAEGGFFSEIYRSRLILDHLPARYGDNATRSSCTSIYYMLTVRNCERLCIAPEFGSSKETNMFYM